LLRIDFVDGPKTRKRRKEKNKESTSKLKGIDIDTKAN